ncbi:hypothetical protein MPLA_2130008 [Mesorhizobium sp. ORS 3359]|nr:hypothetical protein MPLA_2130008 [Mesorhizobium sp. ORS 3359]
MPSEKGYLFDLVAILVNRCGLQPIDGPFDDTSSHVAGCWLWDVKNMADGVVGVKRCPNPILGYGEIETRPIETDRLKQITLSASRRQTEPAEPISSRPVSD